MARPEKHDVDYFPFMVKDGRTFFILEDKYQCKGIGFFANMCRFLAQTPDHHFSIKDEVDQMYFFSKVKCDEESGIDMLNIMAKTGKIDKELWEEHRVIASEDFLNSVKDAYKNRKNEIVQMQDICNKYGVLRITYQENPQEPVVSSDENPQTKKEKTKKEKTIFNKHDFYLPILEIFYFNNFTNPHEEVIRFWNNYSATNWLTKQGVQITDPLSVAANWNQLNSNGKKIPPKLLLDWEKVYTDCKEDLPNELLPFFFELRPLRIQGNQLTVGIPNEFIYKQIEQPDIITPLKLSIKKIMGQNTKLNYELHKK